MSMHGFVSKLAVIGASATLALVAAGTDGSGPGPSDNAAQGTILLDTSPAEKLPSWLTLGGQVRGRVEGPSGTSMINASQDTYYLSRLRISLGVKPTSWLRFFAEAQDARVAGYLTSPAPNTIYNPLDVRQAYIELRHEGYVNMRLRAGRQELLFGGERLIGPADWGMSRTFDALDLSVGRGNAKVDLLAGSSVLVDPTRIDRHKPGEHFYGAYGSVRKVLPGMNVEPYVLFKQTLLVKSENGHLGDALVTSPGVRVFGTAPGRFDYAAETILQRGSYSDDNVTALGGSYMAGWTVFDSRFKPRLSAEYNYASGDRTYKDGERNTFDQFYPSNHGYYGMIDQFGWKNLENWRTGFDFQASRKLKVRFDFNEFYLASVQDGLYNSQGTSIVLNRAATSNHIGSEFNTVALYQWSKIWKFGAGYARLWSGQFLTESKFAMGYTYPYLMFVGTM